MLNEYYMRKVPQQVLFSIFFSIIGLVISVLTFSFETFYWLIGLALFTPSFIIVFSYYNGYTSNVKLRLYSDSFDFYKKGSYTRYLCKDVTSIEKYSTHSEDSRYMNKWDSIEITFNNGEKLNMNLKYLNCRKGDVLIELKRMINESKEESNNF